MDSYTSQVNGKPIVYTDDGIQFGNSILAFSEMSDIVLAGGNPPAWQFTYKGRRMQVPYSPSEKEQIEPFVQRAIENDLADFSDLVELPTKKVDSQPTSESVAEEKTEPVVQAEKASVDTPKPSDSTEIPSKQKKQKSKTKICKHCGAEIAKSAKRCPQCGGKNKKPIYKRVSLYIILAILLVFILIIAGSGNQYKLSDDAANMSASDYKAACEEVSYKELAKNTEKYQGQKLKFTGEVQQVVLDSESGESEYLVSVTKDEYDIYSDNIYVYYAVGSNEKIIDDDIITIYGEASGEESYTSILGEDITIPAVTAAYVDVEK